MIALALAWTTQADRTLPLPSYETAGAAGADLRANFPPAERARGRLLWGGKPALIPTGLRMQVPEGYEVQIRPRSGLALRYGITVLNAPGTIDSDYRGEVQVLLYMVNRRPRRIEHGDRIAQMVVAPVVQPRFDLVDTLSETPRGAGGFGSTGVT